VIRRVLILITVLLAATAASATDLTVGWISRQPEIEYVWNSSNPKVEGWPAAGSQVTWRANVRSFFDTPKTAAYVWSVDGRELSRGTVQLAANAYTTIDLPRTWTFNRERLALSIDTGNAIAEQSEVNNTLEVFTDAISAGFWVEQSFYDHFREHQNELGIGSTSFEDWAQRMVSTFNEMAAMAVYPETPNGVIDRWRIQKIVIAPDNSLPLVPPAKQQRGNEPPVGATQPYSTDRTVDLQWGFRASSVSGYRDRAVSIRNPFYVNYVIIHELGHARYLTDVYAFDLRNQPPTHVVGIPELALRGILYYTPEQGLMNRTYTFIDRYSAIALNLIAGRRAILGNYNDPANVGSFINDLPAQNRVTIRDAQGNLMANADVELFLSEPFKMDAWYAFDYDNEADIRLRTDENGQVLVGRNPFALNGPVVNDWRGSNVIAIVKVNGKYGYVESRLFNLAYWRGRTDFADHELVVGRSTVCGPDGPVITGPAWDAKVGATKLTWQKMFGAVSYNVYVAYPNAPQPRLIATTSGNELNVTFHGRTYWWVEATFDNSCPPVRSDSMRVDAPSIPKRRSVR
jgi:hypothetical protein